MFFGFFPLPFLFSLGQFLSKFTSNFHRVAMPAVFNGLFIRIGTGVVVLLGFLGILSTHNFVVAFIALFAIAAIAGIYYLHHIGQLRFAPIGQSLTKPLFKQMFVFAMFGIIGTVGNTLCVRIDSLMIGKMINMAENGGYTILSFIANTIQTPLMAIYAIAAPIIATAIKEEKFQDIKSIYQKSSLNLLIVALLLFFLVLLSIDDLIQLMPRNDEFTAVFGIVFFLGIAKVVNMTTSLNTQIIIYSKHYRFHFWMILLLGVLNITSNIFFISRFGVLGAAIATTLALVVFNLINLIFVWIKFKMQPFQIESAYAIILALLSWAIVYLLLNDLSVGPFIRLILKSVFFAGLFGGAILYFKTSPDINQLVDQMRSRLLNLLKR